MLDARNAPLINYIPFCEEIDNIFTEKDLEKNPTKTLSSYIAPSILDPLDVLSEQEEQQLGAVLERFGT